MTEELKSAIEEECEEILKEFSEVNAPNHRVIFTEDDDEEYQAQLEYGWWKRDLQNRLNYLRKELGLPIISLKK